MRIQRLAKLFSGLFVTLLLGLVYLQIVKGGQYRIQGQENVIRLIPIPAPRGEVFDRNGALLADSRLSFDIAVVPQETPHLSSLIEKLSKIAGVDQEKLLRMYSRNFATPFAPVRILENVDKELAIALSERRDLPGVMVIVTPRRHYPYGPATAHLLGVVGEIAPEELERLRPYGYKIKTLLGRGGIEESFDNYLRGEDGGMQLEVNSRGYRVATLGHRPAKKGKDVLLTIDIRLQNFIYSLLGEREGAVCVMDPSTGEILALVSSPSFDPSENLSTFFRMPGKPFLNRVTQGLYPPGSTFKLVVGAMVLEERKIRPENSFSCPGYLQIGNEVFQCWREGGHGAQHLIEALQHSCNVFFYRVGLLSGADSIATYARLFGFGEKSGIELPYEAGGFVPTTLWKRLAKHEGWFDGDTANFAIGQGYLSVTPLQLLQMASVIAMQGRHIDPTLVKRVGPHETKPPQGRSLPLSAKTVAVLQEGMIRVVNTPDGTGRYAAVEGLAVAGKTGTAQVAHQSPHAWFVGFGPAQTPRASLVVLVEQGGMGGLVASQMASSIFQEMRELKLL